MTEMFGKFIRENYGVREDIYRQGQEVEAGLEETFKRIDAIRDYNQIKVLKAMQDVGIAERHFGGSSGYGYDDIGRDAIDEVYAKTFGAESAVVRSQIVSGTHCLCTALFHLLNQFFCILCRMQFQESLTEAS